MKRDKNLHPLGFEHHIALTSVVHLRKAQDSAAPRAELERFAHDYVTFHESSLLPHFRQEEEWLLPRYTRQVGEDDPLALKLLQDHIALHRLLLDIREALAQDRDPSAAVVAFADRLEAHIRFEERELFPAIEKVVPAVELKLVGDKLWEALPETVITPGGDGCPVRMRA